MKQIIVNAPAKINISLDIVGLRDDNYHLMKMVMQTIDLYDIIHIKENIENQIKLLSNKNTIPLDKTNIAYKAADAFYNYTNIKKSGVIIEIEKNIPFGAGLGGGSADGAGVLAGLNRLYKTNLSNEELIQIGEKVGADIPFCLIGGTALVEGIGEKITKIKDMPECYIVIVKPTESINTKLAFMIYDNMKDIIHPNTSNVLEGIEKQDIKKISDNMVNVFEQTIKLESVEQIKTIMKKNDALKAIMTGSGSAVFGLFIDREKANKCLKKIKDLNYETFLCCPIKKGAFLI